MDNFLFENSELQVCIRNNNNIESILRFFNQSQIALKEKPQSQFWKDAVDFMADKLIGLDIKFNKWIKTLTNDCKKLDKRTLLNMFYAMDDCDR